MTQQPNPAVDLVSATRAWLTTRYGTELPAALDGLTSAIVVYLRRSRYPALSILPRIAEHYIQDGPRVHALLADSDPAEWQRIMQQVVAFASAHPYYPDIEDAISAPDLDAYEDIRRNLSSYNFECPLDGWINTVVVRRLLRFWRDRQSLRAGGSGFLSKIDREAQRSGELPTAIRPNQHMSLDVLLDEALVAPQIEMRGPAVQDAVEGIVLEDLVGTLIESLAVQTRDPSLPGIWEAIVVHEHKLREVAAMYNLSISQVHYRLRQISQYLRKHPDITGWFDPLPDLRLSRG
ncbi:MAG: sigma-70 family RNA polymerase sigma factor [Chloroflexi bacterium]|nr:sigma-70 family RNA polymerase sigma factor [Chloroflexota bacterium]